MKQSITYLAAALAGFAFLFLVKLMFDMSVQMTRMTEQITQMSGYMQQMSADVHGMREGVERMSGVLQQGSQQIQQLNPMEMIQGVVPGQSRRP